MRIQRATATQGDGISTLRLVYDRPFPDDMAAFIAGLEEESGVDSVIVDVADSEDREGNVGVVTVSGTFTNLTAMNHLVNAMLQESGLVSRHAGPMEPEIQEPQLA